MEMIVYILSDSGGGGDDGDGGGAGIDTVVT